MPGLRASVAPLYILGFGSPGFRLDGRFNNFLWLLVVI